MRFHVVSYGKRSEVVETLGTDLTVLRLRVSLVESTFLLSNILYPVNVFWTNIFHVDLEGPRFYISYRGRQRMRKR